MPAKPLRQAQILQTWIPTISKKTSVFNSGISLFLDLQYPLGCMLCQDQASAMRVGEVGAGGAPAEFGAGAGGAGDEDGGVAGAAGFLR